MHHPEQDREPLVYLMTEGLWARVIKYGAYASTVRYSLGGIQYEVIVENDEFID